MTAALPTYELFAIRYATREARRSSHFIGGDPHDGPMPMDYYVWLARGEAGTFVIDTGFTAEVAAQRGRTLLRCPVDSLRLLDVAPDAVEHVILTHLHYDHAGQFHRFGCATFHLQEKEMQFATGRYMRHAMLAQPFEMEDVCGIVRLNFGRRVMLHAGPHELAPGIMLIPTGGHSGGLQFVRVHTERGWVVVASDVTHYYDNIAMGRPFTIAFHVGDMLEGYDAVLAAASSPAHVIPGHDPKVMEIYPAPRPDLAGIVARLDVAPSADPIRDLRAQ